MILIAGRFCYSTLVTILWLASPPNLSLCSAVEPPVISIMTSVTASASYNVSPPLSEVKQLWLLLTPNDARWPSKSRANVSFRSPVTLSSVPWPIFSVPWIAIGLEGFTIFALSILN